MNLRPIFVWGAVSLLSFGAPPVRAGLKFGLGKAVAARGGDAASKAHGLPACGDGPFFTALPIQLADFTGLVPLGNLNPTGHVFPTDHNYLYVTQTLGVPDNVPVYAPGGAWITEIVASEHVTAGFTDYKFTFSPCRELQLYYGHIQSPLPPELAAQAGGGECNTYSTGGETFNYCRKNTMIRVESGQLIGTAGRPGQFALDVGAIDFRSSPLAYANSSRVSPELLHAVCPLDYFSSGVYAQLQPRIGNFQGTVPRTVPPICGEVEQDRPGTAQGKWFWTGAPTIPEDPHLALVHDNVDPTKPVFSVGNSLSRGDLPLANRLNPGVYAFTPAGAGTENRDFSDVTPGGTIYCYESLTGAAGSILLVRMTNATSLRIERQAMASCPGGPAFTGNYTDFTR